MTSLGLHLAKESIKNAKISSYARIINNSQFNQMNLSNSTELGGGKLYLNALMWLLTQVKCFRRF